MSIANRLSAASVMASAVMAASAASPVRQIRTIDTREPADHALSIMHGESIDLRIRLLNYGSPVDLRGWSIVLHGRTNGQAVTESYQFPGTAGLRDDPSAAAQGWASVPLDVSAWWPADASSGRWTLMAVSPPPAIRIMRAGGPLSVRGSAAAGLQAPLPQSVTATLRAEWLADLAGATNTLAASIRDSISIAGDLLATSNALAIARQAGDAANSNHASQALGLFAATGTVARATGIGSPEGIFWQSVSNGVPVTWQAVPDTNRMYVVSTHGPGYNGPPAGTVFTPTEHEGLYKGSPLWYLSGGSRGWTLFAADRAWSCSGDLPRLLVPLVEPLTGGPAYGMCLLDYVPVTNAYSAVVAPDIDIDADIAAATNALVQQWFLGAEAWMTVSNATLTIWRDCPAGPTSIWSSAESAGGASSIDPALTNALWAALADKADRAWGQYAPDGSPNPDPAFMTFLNPPAVMHASGMQWATSGAYGVLAQSGAVAFTTVTNGEVRWGLDLQTNYIALVRGGSIIVGAAAHSIEVAEGEATIIYPYEGGDFPVLWYSPALGVPFSIQEGVVWVDRQDGTAAVTAPAEAPRGYWYATTTAEINGIADIHMATRLTGGVFGAPGAPPVKYDSTITVTSDGRAYRIPAQEVK